MTPAEKEILTSRIYGFVELHPNRTATEIAENIDLIVRKAATEALDAAVKQEVRSFFEWSRPGRQAVREAVIHHLNEWEKYHITDEGE